MWELPAVDIAFVDPPWREDLWNRETGLDRAADNHYETMVVAKIIELLKKQLRIRPKGLLLLWCPGPIFAKGWAHQVVCALGWEATAVWAWRKTDAKDNDLGGAARVFKGNIEYILWCPRGGFPSFPIGEQPLACISAPRGPHSSKPAIFYDLISKHHPGMVKLEMFARIRRPGWIAHGNELVEITEAA